MTRITLSKEEQANLDSVVEGRVTEFSEIVEVLNLDPKKSFRYSDLRGVNFGSANLSGFDFTGSDLRGGNFRDVTFGDAILPEGQSPESLNPFFDYKVYTKEFDEEVFAQELTNSIGFANLARSLTTHIRQTPSVEISCTSEGELHFTFLIDCSGSMNGRPIELTVASLYRILEALDAAGCTSEVLGFTTRAWRGGDSREKWLAEGKPSLPGRLNDLRHIILKKRSEVLDDSISNLAILLGDYILKENIDGEALFWAHSRAIEHSVDINTIVAISDGAPVDDSTMAVNPGDTLGASLGSVTNWIERAQLIKLGAIGIKHDAGRYYQSSTIAQPDLGNATVTLAFKQLCKILSLPLEVSVEESAVAAGSKKRKRGKKKPKIK